MKNRLLQLLEAEKLTALKFAEIMEVRPSNISHILSGRNNPGFDFISRLLQRFPDVSPDWVINGMGDMYRIGLTQVPDTDNEYITDDIPDYQSNTHLSISIPEGGIAISDDVDNAELVLASNSNPVEAIQLQAAFPSQQDSTDAAQPNSIEIDTEPIEPNFYATDPLLNQDAFMQSEPLPTQSTGVHTEFAPVQTDLNHKESVQEKYSVNQLPNPRQILMFYDDNTFEVFTPRK